jgi:hypothetical protein
MLMQERTDIPAFYAQWFTNRIRAGHCTVPNSYNRKQTSRIFLLPEDVGIIVFCTRRSKLLILYFRYQLSEPSYFNESGEYEEYMFAVWVILFVVMIHCTVQRMRTRCLIDNLIFQEIRMQSFQKILEFY